MAGYLKSGGAVVSVLAITVGIYLAWHAYREHQRRQLSLEAQRLHLAMTEFLKTAQEDINILNSGDSAAMSSRELSRCDSAVKAMEFWLNRSHDRVLALAEEPGDRLDEKTKTDLTDAEKRLRSLLTALATDLKSRIPQSVDLTAPAPLERSEVERKEPILTKWFNRSVKFKTVKDRNVPEEVLTTFVERYSDPEIRLTPYYFKNIKIIKAAKAKNPGVYCISFQAEVFQRDNDKRWVKSPVVLNIIAAETSDGVLSTYENFTEKSWEFPRDGACVHSLWGVNDYEWCETCPYPCMSSYSPIFSGASKP